MGMDSQSTPELQDLLAQLAHFFRANETSISPEQISKCYHHLSATEISALNRLFFLLHQTKTPQSESGDTRGRTSHPHQSVVQNPPGTAVGGEASWHQPSSTPHPCYQHQQSWPRDDSSSGPGCNGLAQEHRIFLTSISRNHHEQPGSHDGSRSGQGPATTSEEFNNQIISRSGFGQHTGLSQQLGTDMPTAWPNPETFTSHQEETATPRVGVDDDAFSKTSLAACSDITFAPSTRRLLEDCKTNRGEFLRAIKESKAAFPTGHGWEAAIATKKENADIRDLMRIYHRFECHNIYRHVVEAGFHTGTHWIRDMRAVLVNKLCHEFPERFQNHKAANRCLNWVDQGCRYHEWTEILSETSDLGYLIALPSDVSHSAYTSRCTKEQMSAASIKFKNLGIHELVKNLELSELGSHISAKLLEMTGKKRKDVGEQMNQDSRKSLRLMPSSGVLAGALHSGLTTTPVESVEGGTDDNATSIFNFVDASTASYCLFGHSAHSFMPALAQEHPGNIGRPGRVARASTVDDSLVPHDPFNNFDLSSPEHSGRFMGQFSALSSSIDEWNDYAEGCTAN